MPTPYEHWISSLLSIVFDASDEVMKIYNNKRYAVKLKSDDSPVTDADLKSHYIIEKGLTALDPSIPILSEEGEEPSFSVRSAWTRYWLIDPLDGTRQFVNQSGEFTINIALIENHRPILGIVMVPQEKSCYWAIKGKGAYLQLAGKPAEAIQTNSTVNSPLKVVVSHQFKRHEQSDEILSKLGTYNLSLCGSSLKICLIAKGEADLYPRVNPCCEWDTAAGQCVLEEAGGQLVDFSGQALRYNMGPSLKSPAFYAVSNKQLTSLCCG